jgi:membrane-associated phospholipid phosphatase
VAVSRIMLGLHFFSDVAVGCVIGIGLGYAAIAIV